MAISLYTSRVTLQALGITDYGIYGAVGGIVGFIGFLNAALAGGSSRFLTYAIGKGDIDETRRTFSTTLTIHIGLGIFIAFLAEVVGLWMIYHKLLIPAERLHSAVWAFQFSILTVAIGVSQVPYNACIVAHERMNLYAYVGIADAALKLGVAFLIQSFGHDKLVFFAMLLFLQSLSTMMFYRIYCARKFKEAQFRISIDKKIFKEITSFSGWNLIYNFVYALNAQGTTVLIGMFFSPAVVAAKSISVKVNSITTQFIGNLRQAMNPQIVKLYAQNDFDNFKSLVLDSGKYSFYIMWLMTLPICLLAEPLLTLWLGTLPPYSVIFVQLIMIDSLFWLFDASFNQAIIATGRMKYNTIYSSMVNVLRFPVIYVLFRCGYSPVWSFGISIFFGCLVGCVLKPFILCKYIGFKAVDFLRLYLRCLFIVVASSIIPLAVYYFVDIENMFMNMLLIGGCSVASILFTVYQWGISAQMRHKVNNVICSKIFRG